MYAPTPEQQYPTPLAGAMCQAASLYLLQKSEEESESPVTPGISARQRASQRWGVLVQTY